MQILLPKCDKVSNCCCASKTLLLLALIALAWATCLYMRATPPIQSGMHTHTHTHKQSVYSGRQAEVAIPAWGSNKLIQGQFRRLENQAGVVHRIFHVNGEPKSGTTWFEFVLKNILRQYSLDNHQCVYEENDRKYVLKCPHQVIRLAWQGKHTVPGIARGHSVTDYSQLPEVGADRLKAAAGMAVQRQEYWLPIFRDPRAVLVACCHAALYPNCDEVLSERISESVGWINLRYRFFQQVIEQSARSPVARITFYNRLKDNFLSEVRELSEFMVGDVLSLRAAQAVQTATSVSATKKLEETGEFHARKKVGFTKVRNGTVCGFVADVTPDTMQKAISIMHKTLTPELNSAFSQC